MVDQAVNRLAKEAGSLSKAKEQTLEEGLTWDEKRAMVRDNVMVELYLRNVVDACGCQSTRSKYTSNPYWRGTDAWT